MYVDGSCQGNPCNAGFGGLLRDAMGTWIHGFYGDIGQTDITKEELLAILNGLKIAWERNLDNVLCVLDSMHALSIFNTFFHLPFICFICFFYADNFLFS